MEQLAQDLKGLSEPTRLRILGLLTRGERCVCDLMAALELPQSTVSRHMSFLKNGGWVTSRRKGKWVYYELAEPEGAIQSQVLATLRGELPARSDMADDFARLEAHLKTKQAETCS